MKISPQVSALLPLKRSSHRQIVTSNDGLAAQVFAGAVGIIPASELEALMVTAVNSHEALVAEVKAAEHIIAAMRSVLTLAQKRAVFDQLEAAGVALDGPVRSVERSAALALAGEA